VIIKLSSNYSIKLFDGTSRDLLIRLSPYRAGVWDEAEFKINEPAPECDAWVVFDGIEMPDTTRCPANRTILITAEPPAYKRYSGQFLRQFAHVVTCHRKTRHPSVRHAPLGLPWYVGKDYDALMTLAAPEKTKQISIISSSRTLTRGHRRRFDAVSRLRTLPGVETFGRGHNPITDKWDALAPYRYSVAIENSEHQDYWTEKIGDCFLAWTVPIYSGCPNIGEFFPEDSFIRLELGDLAGFETAILPMLGPEDYRRRQGAIAEARERVLKRYNLLNLILEICRSLPSPAPRTAVTLVPEARPSYLTRKATAIRRKLPW
jgi:hypothetical protein